MSFWDNFSSEELDLISIKNLATPLGLKRNPWEFSRGAKTVRRYTLDGEDKILVKYTYTFKDGDRSIGSYLEHIEFLNEGGAVYHTIDVPSSFNIKNIKNINRDIRQGRIDYLEAGAEQLSEGADQLDLLATTVEEPTKSYYIDLATQYRALSSALDMVFSHYKEEIREYIERGTRSFEEGVTNEADPTISAILANTVRQPDMEFPNGLTAKESIIHQLTGVIP